MIGSPLKLVEIVRTHFAAKFNVGSDYGAEKQLKVEPRCEMLNKDEPRLSMPPKVKLKMQTKNVQKKREKFNDQTNRQPLLSR